MALSNITLTLNQNIGRTQHSKFREISLQKVKQEIVNYMNTNLTITEGIPINRIKL